MNISKDAQEFINKYPIGRKMTNPSENTIWYVTGVALDTDNTLWITAHSPELNNKPISDEIEFKAEWFEKHMTFEVK